MSQININQKFFDLRNKNRPIKTKEFYFEFDAKKFSLRKSAKKSYISPTIDRSAKAIIERKIATKENIEIARSHILRLEDDWDDRDSPKFDERTFRKVEFTIMNIFKHFRREEIIPPLPEISPNIDGCIGIYYKSSDYEILLQICENNNCLISAEIFGVGEFDAEISLKRTGEFITKWLKLMNTR